MDQSTARLVKMKWPLALWVLTHVVFCIVLLAGNAAAAFESSKFNFSLLMTYDSISYDCDIRQ